MLSRLVLLPILATIFAAPMVFAQDSPFGSLNSTEPNLRLHESVEGITLEDYLNTKENYAELLSLHERAFGARKVELEAQMLARAKDIQVAKLGSTLTYLNNLSSALNETGRASETSTNRMATNISEFSTQVPALKESVENAENTTQVITASTQINASVNTTLGKIIPELAILSVARGEHLIETIEAKAQLIQEHLTASAALGGNTADSQKLYEDSMLALEDARDAYKAITLTVGDGSVVDTSSTAQRDLEDLISLATANMRKTSDGLSKVVAQLRTLYGQSPWSIEVKEAN